MEPTCWHHGYRCFQTLPYAPSLHTISIVGKSEMVVFWLTSHIHLPSSPSYTFTTLLTHTDELHEHSHFPSHLYTTAFHTQLPPSFYLSSSLRNNTNVEWWHFRDTTKIVKITFTRNSFHSFYITPLLRFSVSTMKLPLLFTQWH